jgi:hypothetical protein
MQEYILKNKKDYKSKDIPKDNNKNIKTKKYINNKKKKIINSLSFDFPLEYNTEYINSKLSKYYFLYF